MPFMRVHISVMVLVTACPTFPNLYQYKLTRLYTTVIRDWKSNTKNIIKIFLALLANKFQHKLHRKMEPNLIFIIQKSES